MGIRVHKVIGYGLKSTTPDMFYDQGALMVDTYGNQISKNWINVEDIYTKEGFITYLKNHIEYPWLHIRMLEKKRWNINDCIKTNYESENSPIIIIPPGFENWHRYDNSIDFVEETFCHDQKDRLVELQQGIYPFSSMHQNQHGGQLDIKLSCAWWRMQNLILDQDKYQIRQELIQDHIKVHHTLSVSLGFKDYFDAKDNIAPWVPDILRAFCEFTNLFVDSDMINQLRPMMWVYWA